MENQRKKPQYQSVEGISSPKEFPPENFRLALRYQPRDDDIFIATYPKCGTTWMQNVLVLLFRKGKPIEKDVEIHYRSPFIDKYGPGPVATMPRPGPIKTHLPFNRVPYSPKAKYVCIVRNPKDCCVSFYYHSKRTSTEFKDGTFDEFFEAFMDGEVEYNDYFDHVMSWYEHRNDPNVFFTTYEALKVNPRSVILDLAKFFESECGNIFKEGTEVDTDVMDNILKYSSFDYMSKHTNNAMDYLRDGSNSPVMNDPSMPLSLKYILSQNRPRNQIMCESTESFKFMRKGVIGDWVNHLSEDQSRRIDNRLKACKIDIANLWSQFNCI